jgi:acyl dehydratase
MALDPSLVGYTYPPAPPYLVVRDKIREFADAIGADDAVYRDPAAAAALGHPDVIAPPTFPFVVATRASDQRIDYAAIGVDWARVVHGDQRFSYVRPVRAGDSLVCVITVDEASNRGGLGFLTTRTDVATEAGEPVVTVWSRLVVRAEE